MLLDDTDVLPLASGPLVLVADDEATPRTLLTRMLHALGYQARSCPSGRTALRFLAEHPRDVKLLVADLGMPGMDGGELVERARDLDGRLTALLLAEPNDAGARRLLGGYRDLPLLWKPVGLRELGWTVEGLIGPPPSLADTPSGPAARVRVWRHSSDRQTRLPA